MSMYDDYKPISDIPCPSCGKELLGWQGKDGPCDLLVYRQGEPMPTQGIENRPVDPLEDGFTMYAYCGFFGCGSLIEATGVVMNGRWEGVVNIRLG